MKKSIQGLYLASLGALGALAVVLRTVALFVGFDFTTGYFTDKLLNNISVTVVVTAIVLFSTFLIYKKDYKPRVDIGAPRDYVASACVGVALVMVAFEIAFSQSNLQSAPGTVGVGNIITAIAAALAAVAAFYFATSILFGKGAPLANAAFSIALMLYLVFYALMLYFNTLSPINSPAKLCDQMAYVSLAIFFIYETRILLERPMWRMYAVSGLCATLLSAYSALPSLIVYLVRGQVISHTISETVLTLSLFVFALIRTVSLLTAEEDKENRIEAEKATRAHYDNKEENGEEKSRNYEIELPKSGVNDGTERAD